MSKENSDENTAAEEEYEVEKIVGHKVIKHKKQKKFSYFIKWLNYAEADNTWEKEDNVFAVNMIAAYWNNISPSDPDRLLFQQLQAKKKDPIILNTPQPKIAKVISHASPSPPSSPLITPVEENLTETVDAEEPKGNKITNILTSFLYGGKKKDTPSKALSLSSTNVNNSSSSSSEAPTVQEQKKIDELYKKIRSTTPVNGSTKENENDEDFSPATTSTTVSTVEDTEINVETEEEIEAEVEDIGSADDITVEEDEDEEDEEDEEEDEAIIKRPSRSTTRKRTRSAYTDYFIEQHKKKKMYSGRKETDDDEDDGSIASSIESNDKKKSDNSKGTDSIIFDDTFAKDASLDWNKLAKKVEYIGREVENGPIYCVVSWEDEVRSFHSLELVRKKRPDLVIDAFVESLYKV